MFENRFGSKAKNIQNLQANMKGEFKSFRSGMADTKGEWKTDMASMKNDMADMRNESSDLGSQWKRWPLQ